MIKWFKISLNYLNEKNGNISMKVQIISLPNSCQFYSKTEIESNDISIKSLMSGTLHQLLSQNLSDRHRTRFLKKSKAQTNTNWCNATLSKSFWNFLQTGPDRTANFRSWHAIAKSSSGQFSLISFKNVPNPGVPVLFRMNGLLVGHLGEFPSQYNCLVVILYYNFSQYLLNIFQLFSSNV